MWVYLISSSYTVHLRLEVIHSNCTKNVDTAVSVHHTSVFVLLTCGIVFRLIVLTFLLLMPSNRQLNRLILVSFYNAMTIERVLAELLCFDCERVFCSYLYFMFLHVFYIVGSCKCQVSSLVVQLLFWANRWWWLRTSAGRKTFVSKRHYLDCCLVYVEEFDLRGIHTCFLPLVDISLGLIRLLIYIYISLYKCCIYKLMGLRLADCDLQQQLINIVSLKWFGIVNNRQTV